MRQKIKITFRTGPFKELSGKPGYLVGYPVITATNTQNVFSNQGKLGIFSVAQCANLLSNFEFKTSVVNFGEDQKSECTLEIDPNQYGCPEAQGQSLNNFFYLDQF